MGNEEKRSNESVQKSSTGDVGSLKKEDGFYFDPRLANMQMVPNIMIKRFKEAVNKKGEKVVYVTCLWMGGNINTMCDASLISKLSEGTVGSALFEMDMKMLDVFDYGKKENKCIFSATRLVDFVPQKL